jgi:hypothetical protein
MSEARDIELLFAIWEQNVETVRALNRSLKQDSLARSGIAPQLVAHLKHCAVALVKPRSRSKDLRAITQTSAPTTVPAQRSTRTCSRSTNQNGSDPRSICASWRSNLVSFAGDRQVMPIISALHNPEVWGSRSATNSLYRYAPFTISRTTQPAMSGSGGRNTRLIRSQWPRTCGAKASNCQHRSNNPSTEATSRNE